MITVSEERYISPTPGYITLQDEDGAYYYIHRNLYDQAVILEDRYGENIEKLQELIGGNPGNTAVEKFVKYVPRPVNIMGYFLALVTEDIEGFVDAVGALDVISSTINLRNLIKFPIEIRQTVQFGMSIKNEYQDRWDHFFEGCYKYDDVKSAISGNFNQPVRSSRNVEPDEDEYDEDDIEEEVDEDDMSAEELAAKRAAEFEAAFDAALAPKNIDDEPEPEPTTPLEEIPASLGGNGLATIAKAKRRAL